MFNNKTKEIPYKETKEYLDRQQSIDLLLVLSKINAPDCLVSNDVKAPAIEIMKQTLEKLKH